MPEGFWLQLHGMAAAWLAVAIPLSVIAVLTRVHRFASPKIRRPMSWTAADVTLLTAAGFLAPMLVGGVLQNQSWWKPSLDELPIRLLEPLMVVGGAASIPVVQDLNLLHTQLMWAKLFSFPLVVLLAGLLLVSSHRHWPTISPAMILPSLALMARSWLLLTPIVFVTNFACLAVLFWLNQSPEAHPLSQIGTGSRLGPTVLFVVSVCVMTPLLEEFIFRGVLLSWARQSCRWSWLLIGVTWLLTFRPLVGPMIFLLAGSLAAVMLHNLSLRQRRSRLALWSSSFFFAAIHMNVWPTPIPLLVLGLGLGWLAIRAGSWVPSALSHGFFNLVSSIYLILNSTPH